MSPFVASHLGDESILQKLKPFIPELNTHLTWESDMLPKTTGEGRAMAGQLLLHTNKVS